MHTTSRGPHHCTSLVVGGVQAAIWIALGAAALMVVPGFEKIFADFEVSLPAMTISVIHVSRFLGSYWYLAVQPVLLWPLVNWGVVCLLSRSPEVAAPRRLWYIVTSLAPLVVLVLSLAALFYPLILLQRRLS